MMSEAHRVLSLRSRQKSAQEAEPLYSALNTVNVLLGNVLVRKAIHSLCVDDTAGDLQSFELLQWPKRSESLKESQAAADLCVRRTRKNVLPRGQVHDARILQSAGDATRSIEYRKSIAEYGSAAPQTSGALFGRLELHGCVQSALQALLPRCRQNVK